MRTNIEIDSTLMREAQAASGATTKKEAVRLGLELLVMLGQQEALKDLRGQIEWIGDLDEMRADRS